MEMRINNLTLKSLAAHDAMPRALKTVAKEARRVALVEARGLLLIRYDLGVRLRAVCEREDRYTARGVELLATYLGVPPKDFYGLIAVANAFSRTEVEAMANRLMSDGGRLTHDHVVAIGQARRADYAELIERVFEESFTIRQLRKLLRDREVARSAARAARRVSGAAER